jgi:hypothetical protein
MPYSPVSPETPKTSCNESPTDTQGNFDFSETSIEESHKDRKINLSILPRASLYQLPLHPIEETTTEDQISRKPSLKSPESSPHVNLESRIFKSQLAGHSNMKSPKKPQRNSLKDLSSPYSEPLSPKHLPSLRNAGNSMKIAKSLRGYKKINKYDI